MNDDVDDERVWTHGWPEQVLGTRQPTPAEEAYGKTLIPLAEEALAASGELPTASQAPSQGGIPPYTPAASSGALSAEAIQQRDREWCSALAAIDVSAVAELNGPIKVDASAALAAHAQKVREQVIEECYLAARGTKLLDKVAAYQHYWRGRAEAAEDVRKLKRDACQVCHGAKGGEPGNENIVDGVVMCDYCHAEKVTADGQQAKAQ